MSPDYELSDEDEYYDEDDIMEDPQDDGQLSRFSSRVLL